MADNVKYHKLFLNRQRPVIKSTAILSGISAVPAVEIRKEIVTCLG